MTKKQLAPYAMPVVYEISVVIIVIGLAMIAMRALTIEAWEQVWR